MVRVETKWDGVTTFTKNANRITIDDDPGYFIDLDDDGYPTEIRREYDDYFKSYTFNFQDGNLMQLTYSDSDDTETYEFKYDKKKSPFYHCKTPKWYLVFSNSLLEIRHYDVFLELGDIDFVNFSNNNITEIICSDEERNRAIRYEYDSAGYPTKSIMFDRNKGSMVYNYIYQ